MVFIPYPPGQVNNDPPVEAAFEIGLQRELTEWFIAQDPVDIVLRTRTTNRTPSGATETATGPDRPSQRFKFVYGGSTGAGRAGIVETGDGRERMFSYVLVGKWDAEIAPGDFFEDYQGNFWEVEELLPNNDYETKATLRSYGARPQYA